MSDFSIGEKLKVTLFGQSHGPAIGCVMEGFPAGQKIDGDFVAAFMARRAPGQNAWSTPRKEADQPEILSGLNADGLTCGAPITAVIRNSNTRSGDYEALKDVPRPGHADYTARVKYGNAWDGRGGGQFSARLTAPLCFAGALAKSYLEEKGIHIAAHIARIGRIEDAKPDAVNPSLPFYKPGAFPVLSLEQGEAMKREIDAARSKGDSVGGAAEPGAVRHPRREGPAFRRYPKLWQRKQRRFLHPGWHGTNRHQPLRRHFRRHHQRHAGFLYGRFQAHSLHRSAAKERQPENFGRN